MPQSPFKDVTYSLLGDDSATDYFEINAETGRIRVSRDIKADVSTDYQVSVARRSVKL